MAKGVTIQGLDKLQKKLTGLPSKIKKEIGAELGFAAQEMASLAQTDAPADQGFLRQEISVKKIDDLNYELISGADYSAFVEFGTGTKVSIPAGLEADAAQHKGAGNGTFKDFIIALVNWIRRKGISGTYSVKTRKRTGSRIDQYAEDYALAYRIALKILKVGIKPHPFFFKQQAVVEPKTRKNVQNILDDLAA